MLHINISDGGGGVGRAAYRLHQGLKASGLDSRMLVDVKTTDDPSVIGPTRAVDKLWLRLRTRADKIPGWFGSGENWQYLSFNYLPNPRILRILDQLQPRLIHLHWIGDGLLPLQAIQKLKTYPLVATLHGRWLFNGAQHLHSDQSRRFREGFLKNNRDPGDRGLDIDRWTWNRKKKALSNLQLTVLTLSRWMERDAAASVLLEDFPIVRIPNGLDLDTFFPHPKALVRKELGLDPDKQYLVFGANFATRDDNKGFSDFVEAVRILEAAKVEFEVIVFGSDQPEQSLPYISKTHFFGFVKDEASLSRIYASGDCFVLPSKQDNLPNTVMESLASGTPCVGYDVGGVSDMIQPGKTGYLATPMDTEGLADGILKILNAETDRKLTFLRQSRELIEQEFGRDKQVADVSSLYQRCIRNFEGF